MTLLNDPVRCQYCGNFHQTICPTIKAMEYHPNGTVKRVEFKTANDYPASSGWPLLPTIGAIAG